MKQCMHAAAVPAAHNAIEYNHAISRLYALYYSRINFYSQKEIAPMNGDIPGIMWAASQESRVSNSSRHLASVLRNH